MGGQPQNLMSNYLLKPGENVVGAWRTTMVHPLLLAQAGSNQTLRWSWNGYLVLTNQRLSFLEEKGVLTKTYHTKEVIDLESLVNVSVAGVVKKLSITYQSGGQSIEKSFWGGAQGLGGKGYFQIRQAIQQVRAARMQGLEQEKKQSRVQYLLDFSFLKSQMEKGGMTVTSIRCPNCGGSLALPSTGTTTQCGYCGTAIIAQDVFDKMKGMIGGLP